MKIKYLDTLIIALLISFYSACSSNSIVEFPPSPTPKVSRDRITSISLSSDGIILIWGGPRTLYIAKTANLPKYKAYPLDKFPFATENIKLSLDGNILYGLGWGILYRAIVKNESISLKNYYKNEDLNNFSLETNKSGDSLLLALDCKDNTHCRPGCSYAILLQYIDDNFVIIDTITQIDSCTFVNKMYIDNNNRIYFNFTKDKQISDLYKIGLDGKYIPFFKTKYRVEDLARTGECMLLSGKVFQRDKRGDSLITLFYSEIKNGVPSKPTSILLPHIDPIAWGAQFTPDGKNLLWTHFVRDEDGNAIIRREIRISKFLNGKWMKQQILFQVPVNKQIWNFTVSNNGIALSTTENDLIFYPSLKSGRKPIHVKIHVDPVIIPRCTHVDKPIQLKPKN